MKISLSLLKKYLNLDLSPKEIAESLTLLGLEVDEIINEEPQFSNVVVAKIISAEKHPAADRLSVAEVFDGKETKQIVCGAPNCTVGLVVPLAQIGAVLTDSNGELFKIKKSKLRQVESFGMLCTASELHLYDESDQLLVLPDDYEIGKDLAFYTHDPIFEISLTPNLGHCMSAIGIARELSALLNIPLKESNISLHPPFAETDKEININTELCSKYACRRIQGVKVEPSPFWLKKQLLQCGIRPINNVVDITNLVMLELGQPMHAFDMDLLEGKEISVAQSEQEVQLKGLDENDYLVPKNTLLISDSKKPVAIAGVIGLHNTAVNDQTKNVLLEAASFDPISVRKTSKAINFRSESSQRFEKGIDIENVNKALDLAAMLLQDLCKATIGKIVCEQKGTVEKKVIRVRKERVETILGVSLSLNEISEILKRLGFHIKTVDATTIMVSIPTYRNDISQEIDLIEEVARIYGFNKIEKAKALYSTTKIGHSFSYLIENQVRTKLLQQNLQEVLNCDLISKDDSEILKELHLRASNHIPVLHSKSSEHSVLRCSLLPGILKNVQYNIDRKCSDLSFFEIGKIHFYDEENRFIEQTMAAVCLTGSANLKFWSDKSRNCDFYDLKGILEGLFSSFLTQDFRCVKSDHANFHPFVQADIFVNDINIGVLGELHPDILAKKDIKQKVFFSEINIQALSSLARKRTKLHSLPQYPSSERDWTITVPKDLPLSHIKDTLYQFKPEILEEIFLLDIYESKDLGPYKNMTLRFIYRDLKHTLSFEEVEKAHNTLKEKISEHLQIAPNI